jgi:hypothetical protein
MAGRYGFGRIGAAGMRLTALRRTFRLSFIKTFRE